MRTKHIDRDRASKVYDILVSTGGANEIDRDSFLHHHCDSDNGCREWRFGGKLLFGGKYRSLTNTVTYYKEDETEELIRVKNEINTELKKLDQ